MISNSNRKCKIFVDYLNHDIIIEAMKHGYIRIILCLDIQQFIANDNNIKPKDANGENKSEYYSEILL